MRSTSYTFAIGITSASIYSVLEPIEKSTGLTLNDLNAGTGYMVWKALVLLPFLMLKSLSSYSLGGAACSGSLLRFNMESDLYTYSRC